MKQVLIVDAPPLFREFFKDKMTAENIQVEVATIARGAYTKMVSMIPDVIFIDADNDLDAVLEFLEQKKANPNVSKTPVFFAATNLDNEIKKTLPQYHVVKYFNKPVKFDVFFESLGRLLHTAFTIDTTPCILEMHLNNNIIFIEVAQGLNREKMTLLKYKITEMIEGNKITSPKIVLMLTNLELTFVDGANLEFLLDSIISNSHIMRRNVKVLSMSGFLKDLVQGHGEYQGIEVVENLSSVLTSLVGANPLGSDVSDTISDRILSATEDSSEGSVQMQFMSESGGNSDAEDSSSGITAAIVDSDMVVRMLLQKAFAARNAQTVLFESGAEFLAATNSRHFDVVIMDVFMPGVSGFDILMQLRRKQFQTPIIVYSSASQREAVMRALSLGAKSYLVKPIKPEAVVQKAIEVIIQ